MPAPQATLSPVIHSPFIWQGLLRNQRSKLMALLGNPGERSGYAWQLHPLCSAVQRHVCTHAGTSMQLNHACTSTAAVALGQACRLRHLSRYPLLHIRWQLPVMTLGRSLLLPSPALCHLGLCHAIARVADTLCVAIITAADLPSVEQLKEACERAVQRLRQNHATLTRSLTEAQAKEGRLKGELNSSRAQVGNLYLTQESGGQRRTMPCPWEEIKGLPSSLQEHSDGEGCLLLPCRPLFLTLHPALPRRTTVCPA
jgi:hypothetical protein